MLKNIWISLGLFFGIGLFIAVINLVVIGFSDWRLEQSELEALEIANELDAYEERLEREEALCEHIAYLEGLNGFEKLENDEEVSWLILAETPYDSKSEAYQETSWEQVLNSLNEGSLIDKNRILFRGSNIIWTWVYHDAYKTFEKEDFIFIDYRSVKTPIEDPYIASLFFEKYMEEHLCVNPLASIVIIIDQYTTELIKTAITELMEVYPIEVLDASEMDEDQVNANISDYLLNGECKEYDANMTINDLSVFDDYKGKLDPVSVEGFEPYRDYLRSRSDESTIKYSVKGNFVLFTYVGWEEGRVLDVLLDDITVMKIDSYEEERVIRTVVVPLNDIEQELKIQCADKDDDGSIWFYGVLGPFGI